MFHILLYSPVRSDTFELPIAKKLAELCITKLSYRLEAYRQFTNWTQLASHPCAVNIIHTQ